MITPKLPFNRIPFPAYKLSLITAGLLAVASLAGLLFPSTLYPTEELRRSFIATDVVSLFIGLPVLLGAMAFTRRDSLLGLLFWPGALFCVTYNSLTYVIAMPLTLPFVLNLALMALSGFAIFELISCIDAVAVRARLQGKVFERVTAGALIGFGVLMALLAVGVFVSTLSGQVATPWPDLATRIADLLITPAWVIGGIWLWRRQAFGYVTGAGLLFQASMLFIGLLVFFVLQPFLAAIPFRTEDFVAVAAMSPICFVPLGLFMRGIARFFR